MVELMQKLQKAKVGSDDGKSHKKKLVLSKKNLTTLQEWISKCGKNFKQVAKQDSLIAAKERDSSIEVASWRTWFSWSRRPIR